MFSVKLKYVIAYGLPAFSLRFRLVLQELASCGNAYPMIPHGRPGRGSKARNQACCAYTHTHLEYNAVVWITADWNTSCNKLLIPPMAVCALDIVANST